MLTIAPTSLFPLAKFGFKDAFRSSETGILYLLVQIAQGIAQSAIFNST